MKLLICIIRAFISEILPANLNDVLLIDTDMIFVDDIYSVWKEFQLFKRKQTALGLVPWRPRMPPNYVYRGYEPDAFIAEVVLLVYPCYLNGHTYHYLKNGAQWKQACNGEYVRNIHVVPSKLLLNKDHYLGNLYRFFREIPIEWTDHCGKE